MQTIIEFYIWTVSEKSEQQWVITHWTHASTTIHESVGRVTHVWAAAGARPLRGTKLYRDMSAVESRDNVSLQARSWPVRTTNHAFPSKWDWATVARLHSARRSERSAAIERLLTESIHCFLHTKSAPKKYCTMMEGVVFFMTTMEGVGAGLVYFQNFLQNGYYSIFVCIW